MTDVDPVSGAPLESPEGPAGPLPQMPSSPVSTGSAPGDSAPASPAHAGSAPTGSAPGVSAPASPAPAGSAPKRLRRLYLAIGGVCVLLLLVITFVAQNYRTVPVHVLGWRFHLALGLTILCSAVVGGLVVLLITGTRILRLRTRGSRQ